jgi:hypothetical protein
VYSVFGLRFVDTKPNPFRSFKEERMAKPIQPTPVLSGTDAQVVLRELEQGAEATPHRQEFLHDAQSIYARHRTVMQRELELKQASD